MNVLDCSQNAPQRPILVTIGQIRVLTGANYPCYCIHMTKGEKEHKFRLDPDRWKVLKGIALGLVRDDEMPAGSRPGDPRISPLLKLIADGRLIVTRAPEG